MYNTNQKIHSVILYMYKYKYYIYICLGPPNLQNLSGDTWTQGFETRPVNFTTMPPNAVLIAMRWTVKKSKAQVQTKQTNCWIPISTACSTPWFKSQVYACKALVEHFSELPRYTSHLKYSTNQRTLTMQEYNKVKHRLLAGFWRLEYRTRTCPYCGCTSLLRWS